MYRFILPAALLVGACGSSASAEQSSSVTIPRGTPVTMYVPGTISPDRVNLGDVFQTQAASDVTIGGVVVVRKGAEGQGSVARAKRKQKNAGFLAIEFDWVYAVDGTKIALAETDEASSPALMQTSNAAVRGPSSFGTFGFAGFFGMFTVFANGANVQPFGTPGHRPEPRNDVGP